MGQRSASETIARLMLAFTESRTWTQAELARRLELSVPAVRRHLVELQAGGMPLDRDDEDPPQVFWSVPKGWFPGGVVLDGAEVHRLLSALLHLPRSGTRDRLLRKLTSLVPSGNVHPSPEAVVTGELTPEQERLLEKIEEGMARREAMRMRYESRSGASARWRVVSVHRVVAGEPVRLVVTCHESGALRWFRLDHVRELGTMGAQGYRAAGEAELEGFLRGSVDGFHGGTFQVEEFEVSGPDARWVGENLRAGWQGRWEGGVLRVRAETGAVVQVARFVVGLGGSARAVTPGLGERSAGCAPHGTWLRGRSVATLGLKAAQRRDGRPLLRGREAIWSVSSARRPDPATDTDRRAAFAQGSLRALSPRCLHSFPKSATQRARKGRDAPYAVTTMRTDKRGEEMPDEHRTSSAR